MQGLCQALPSFCGDTVECKARRENTWAGLLDTKPHLALASTPSELASFHLDVASGRPTSAGSRSAQPCQKLARLHCCRTLAQSVGKGARLLPQRLGRNGCRTQFSCNGLEPKRPGSFASSDGSKGPHQEDVEMFLLLVPPLPQTPFSDLGRPQDAGTRQKLRRTRKEHLSLCPTILKRRKGQESAGQHPFQFHLGLGIPPKRHMEMAEGLQMPPLE